MFNKKDGRSVILIILSIFIGLLGLFLYVFYGASDVENTIVVTKTRNEIKRIDYNHLGTNTFKIDSLEIANSDFDSTYTWDEANQICLDLGEGWRLPDMEELNLIFKQRKKIGGFKVDKYWSSDIHIEKVTSYEIYFNYQGFQDVSPITSELCVRAVRKIRPRN